eukprot:TRINITY_DN47031_c0_g1_i1.p1 TRINITY_DN47031_c0_g1~~TRINITY_DN47031_c0_g1_i1.p1  ORF type:complete len:138 (+),score=42.51 TRINITY_DN47031_c0_g1_i1:23-415(+)
MFVRRPACVRCVRWVLGTVSLCGLVMIYLMLAKLSAEEKAVNKAARVVDLVLYKENEGLIEEEDGNATLNELVPKEEEENKHDKVEVPADEWVEDKDEKIMDAKVMKKGDKKLIIVDMPNPKARWARPSE